MFKLKSWLGIDYSPHSEERSFLERAQTRRVGEVETTVAVPSDRESERVFGVRLLPLMPLKLPATRAANTSVRFDGQPVWIGQVSLISACASRLRATKEISRSAKLKIRTKETLVGRIRLSAAFAGPRIAQTTGIYRLSSHRDSKFSAIR